MNSEISNESSVNHSGWSHSEIAAIIHEVSANCGFSDVDQGGYIT